MAATADVVSFNGMPGEAGRALLEQSHAPTSRRLHASQAWALQAHGGRPSKQGDAANAADLLAAFAAKQWLARLLLLAR